MFCSPLGEIYMYTVHLQVRLYRQPQNPPSVEHRLSDGQECLESMSLFTHKSSCVVFVFAVNQFLRFFGSHKYKHKYSPTGFGRLFIYPFFSLCRPFLPLIEDRVLKMGGNWVFKHLHHHFFIQSEEINNPRNQCHMNACRPGFFNESCDKKDF